MKKPLQIKKSFPICQETEKVIF